MTGVLNALVGQMPGLRYTVNVAGNTSLAGFISGTQGSISSSTFKGQTFLEVFSQDNLPTIRMALRIKFSASGLSQSLFSQVIVQCDDGTFRTLRTSDAGFDNSSTSVWQWGTGGSPASFSAWGTNGVTRAFYIL